MPLLHTYISLHHVDLTFSNPSINHFGFIQQRRTPIYRTRVLKWPFCISASVKATLTAIENNLTDIKFPQPSYNSGVIAVKMTILRSVETTILLSFKFQQWHFVSIQNSLEIPLQDWSRQDRIFRSLEANDGSFQLQGYFHYMKIYDVVFVWNWYKLSIHISPMWFKRTCYGSRALMLHSLNYGVLMWPVCDSATLKSINEALRIHLQLLPNHNSEQPCRSNGVLLFWPTEVIGQSYRKSSRLHFQSKSVIQ